MCYYFWFSGNNPQKLNAGGGFDASYIGVIIAIFIILLIILILLWALYRRKKNSKYGGPSVM